jgi:hypothetical protein
MTARYHYVPTLFLAVLLALAADTAAAWQPGTRRRTTAALVAMLLWLSLRAHWDQRMIVRAAALDMLRGETLRLASDVARVQTDPVHLPNSPIGGGLLVMYDPQFPGRAALCTIAHPDGVVHGRTVRFVERDPALLAAVRAQGDTPVARLMVSPAEAPPGTR